MVQLTPELITRMDRPGPRYTSYPTAPVFHTEFGDAAYREALTRASRSDAPLKFYLHLPFCEALCTYCACNVVVRKDVRRAADPYVGRVLAEADRVLEHLGDRRPIARLHFGGGTPNYLIRDQMEQLMAGLKDRLRFTDDAELALEVDPRHLDDGQLPWLRGLGFNRVSLGVQDFDAEVQNEIGRYQSFAQTFRAADEARKAGFGSLNLDIVYGLPGQSRERFARTLDKVFELDPDRLAIFSFAFVPAVKPHQKKIDVSKLPSPVEKATLMADAIERLTAAGYVQVGMDHFAKPGDALARSLEDGTLQRSFQGYEPGPAMELLSLGLTGVGDLGGAYVQNHHRLDHYEEALSGGALPVERGWARTTDDEIRRTTIWSLMCRFRLRYEELRARFGIEHDEYFADALPALAGLEEQGLIERGPEGVHVTPLGRLFVRNVAMPYDAYLPKQKGQFSRTV